VQEHLVVRLPQRLHSGRERGVELVPELGGRRTFVAVGEIVVEQVTRTKARVGQKLRLAVDRARLYVSSPAPGESLLREAWSG
jgi:hypothetical protein